jgi:hypothetical protein
VVKYGQDLIKQRFNIRFETVSESKNGYIWRKLAKKNEAS